MNVVLTVTQIGVGLFAKSQGLVADSIHSLSDLVSDFVVLFASHHSKKDADADHPYGHHRFETAASLVLGGLLLAVEPIVDMGRTALNVTGQALVPTIVAKREGILDKKTYDAKPSFDAVSV